MTGRRVGLALLAAGLVGGCGQSTAGEPTAAPSESGDPPRITDPLDLPAVAGDPCGLLTPAQRDRLSLGIRTSSDDSIWGEPQCLFENDEVRIDVSPDTMTGQGVDLLLLQPGVDPWTVSGYPAGRYDDDYRGCRVSVGTAEGQELIVGYYLRQSDRPEHQDPCAFVTTVAEMVLRNIPPAS